MKSIIFFLSLLLLLTLAACTLPVPVGETPNANVAETQAPDLTFVAPGISPTPTNAPAFTETAPPPTAEPPATESPAVEAVNTPTALPPKPTVEEAAAQPTATKPAPTASPAPVITFDAPTALGEPSYHNPMQFPNLAEWAIAGTKNLPDDENIRLQFKDGQLYVTGKRLDFSTWWFSYHTLQDAYIQMAFNTEDCSGEDAYGIIFRGPPHQAGQSYGYVVSFTCSGKLWIFRLDGVDPWRAENLIDIEEVSAINQGLDQPNVIGVRAEGDQLTVFANGKQVAAVEDDHFEKGRVGVFVRSASPDIYTYRVTDFAYWILGEED